MLTAPPAPIDRLLAATAVAAALLGTLAAAGCGAADSAIGRDALTIATDCTGFAAFRRPRVPAA